MRTGAIIQARMGSTRLPGKVLLPAPDGRPLLAVLLERVERATTLEHVIVATTTRPEDRAIAEVAKEAGAAVYRGPVDDVLARYYGAARRARLDLIVRLTADNPLVCPELIDELVRVTIRDGWEYSGTAPTVPEGLDVEVFPWRCLREAHQRATLPSEREHVTAYLRRTRLLLWQYGPWSQGPQGPQEANEDHGHIRVTVDTPEDYQVVRDVLSHLGTAYTLADLLALYARRPDLWAPNRDVERNPWIRQWQAELAAAQASEASEVNR